MTLPTVSISPQQIHLFVGMAAGLALICSGAVLLACVRRARTKRRTRRALMRYSTMQRQLVEFQCFLERAGQVHHPAYQAVTHALDEVGLLGTSAFVSTTRNDVAASLTFEERWNVAPADRPASTRVTQIFQFFSGPQTSSRQPDVQAVRAPDKRLRHAVPAHSSKAEGRHEAPPSLAVAHVLGRRTVNLSG
jgi:hypothetical protein